LDVTPNGGRGRVRLLHITASYLPAVRYGGTIVSSHGLCKALAARGHDVHVLTTSVDGDGDSPVPLGTAVDLDGVKVWYFASRYGRRLYWSPAMARHFTAHAKAFDLVHIHGIFLWPFWMAARGAMRVGVPYVVSLRGMLEKGLIARKSRWLKSLWIRLIERRNLEEAAAIHVTSRREASEAAAFGFRLPPLHQIPNGVDMVAQSGGGADGENDGSPYLLFLGRVNWKKGLDRLVRSLAHAPGVRLVIAGNDEEGYGAEIQRLADGLGVAERVQLIGDVRGARKDAILSGAAAVVLPSYSENFGNVVVEAMAAGRPVVVTPEVGVADLVRESGAGVVVDGAPDALGGAIRTLMSDAASRHQMGQRGRAASARYAWSTVAAAMEELYRSLISSRARAS